jgi:hypothetical protein
MDLFPERLKAEARWRVDLLCLYGVPIDPPLLANRILDGQQELARDPSRQELERVLAQFIADYAGGEGDGYDPAA